MKFLADVTLGKLSKWLRILGYDTIFRRKNIDAACLADALQEGRIVLTRNQAMSGLSYEGRLVVIFHDRVKGQLEELSEKLVLQWTPERFFTRCVKCNAELEAVPKEEVAQSVPGYVYENSSDFRRCPLCGGIFWPGTHRENMLKFIMNRNPSDRP